MYPSITYHSHVEIEPLFRAKNKDGSHLFKTYGGRVSLESGTTIDSRMFILEGDKDGFDTIIAKGILIISNEEVVLNINESDYVCISLKQKVSYESICKETIAASINSVGY